GVVARLKAESWRVVQKNVTGRVVDENLVAGAPAALHVLQHRAKIAFAVDSPSTPRAVDSERQQDDHRRGTDPETPIRERSSPPVRSLRCEHPEHRKQKKLDAARGERVELPS